MQDRVAPIQKEEGDNPILQLTMLVIITLVFTILPGTASIDHSYEGIAVTMQSDVDTILIHTKMNAFVHHLEDLTVELGAIKRGIILNAENSIKAGDKNAKFEKVLVGLISNGLESVNAAKLRLLSLFHSDSPTKGKRALEILGDFLSGITGVPSAHDHRKVLEQLKMLELDSRSLTSLMRESNAQTKNVISALKTHENDLISLHKNADLESKQIMSIKDRQIQLLTAMSMTTKILQTLINISENIDKANDILSRSDSALLSRNSISQSQLSELIDRIYLSRKDRQDAPIFSGKSCNFYYQLPLAHSWADKGTYEIITLLQVPISELNIRNSLLILDRKNLISTTYEMAVVDLSMNTYRYLSMSDFLQCTELGGRLICQKRKITIKPRAGCSLQIKNCKVWADTLVHDITNSKIILSQQNNSTATVSCPGKNEERITLPKKCILDIHPACQLSSDAFSIGNIEYTHLADFESAKISTVEVDLDNELEIVNQGPTKILEKKINLTRHDLNKLEIDNEAFESRLKEQEIKHKELWEKADGGRTGIEQIIIYALIAAAIFFSLFATSWAVKVQIQIWKLNGGDGTKVKDTMKKCREIESRVMDLETDIQLSSMRGAPTAPPPPFNPHMHPEEATKK